MTKYPCLGSTLGDLTGLYNVLNSLETELFSSVSLNEAGTELTILDADENVLLRWAMSSASSATGTITAYTSATDTTGIALSGSQHAAPTFVVQCTGGIYIARSNSLTADAHTSFVCISGSASGATAFTIGGSTTQPNMAKAVRTVAFGDQLSPANTHDMPVVNTTLNCTCYYPLPTNSALDNENYTTNFVALAFSQQATNLVGKSSVNGGKCYTNGFFLLMDN